MAYMGYVGLLVVVGKVYMGCVELLVIVGKDFMGCVELLVTVRNVFMGCVELLVTVRNVFMGYALSFDCKDTTFLLILQIISRLFSSSPEKKTKNKARAEALAVICFP